MAQEKNAMLQPKGEQKSAAEWIGVGIGAASVGLQGLQMLQQGKKPEKPKKK